MAGLTAARELRRLGMGSVILDKGRAPGGRMATRTIGGARFDHGAQHFSVRSARFRILVEEMEAQGVVRQWFRSHSHTRPERGVEARHAGVAGMRRIPEYLARDLDVRTGITVDRLVASAGGVAADAGKESLARGAAVILTPPLPQTRRLLDASGISPPPEPAAMLEEVDYDACLAVMASTDGPSGLPEGHLAPEGEGGVAWIADNRHKGTSAEPAVTIHSTPEFADAHLEADPAEWVPLLCRLAGAHLKAPILDAVGHRWRFASPRTTFASGAVAFDAGIPVVLAGEVFAGARVEGAFSSGVAAAGLVADLL
jgi:predicted NAD/FAD-dependent oxidoreductase